MSTSDDFGYASVRPDQIGTNLATAPLVFVREHVDIDDIRVAAAGSRITVPRALELGVINAATHERWVAAMTELGHLLDGANGNPDGDVLDPDAADTPLGSVVSDPASAGPATSGEQAGPAPQA